MKRYSVVGACFLGVLLVCVLTLSVARPALMQETLVLSASGPMSGAHALTTQGGMVQIQAGDARTALEFSLTGLNPRTLHTLWLIFDNGSAPFVTGSCVTGCMATDANGNAAPIFPFTPGAADNAGYRAGVGLDPNAFVSDGNGNAKWTVILDYNLLNPHVAPVLLRPGAQQSAPVCTDSLTSFQSRVDSGFMRTFNASSSTPSFEVSTGLEQPVLVRGTVVRLVIAEHFEGVTHGHTPGINFPASPCGDWAERLTGALADAVPST